MKRITKPKHPLARLRRCTDHRTQEAFAEFVSVAPITIRRIESGTLKLSRGLAQRIVYQTGVDPFSLTGPAGTQPLSALDRQPYTEMSYLGWMLAEKTRSIGDQAIIEHAEILKEMIEELLFGSVKCPQPKFAAVVWSLCQAVGEVAEAYQLDSSVVSFRARKVGPEDRPGYERAKESAFLCRMLGRPDLPTEAANLEYERLGDAHLFLHANEHPEAEHARKVATARAMRVELLKALRLKSKLDKGPMSGVPIRKRGRPPKKR